MQQGRQLHPHERAAYLRIRGGSDPLLFTGGVHESRRQVVMMALARRGGTHLVVTDSPRRWVNSVYPGMAGLTFTGPFQPGYLDDAGPYGMLIAVSFEQLVQWEHGLERVDLDTFIVDGHDASAYHGCSPEARALFNVRRDARVILLKLVPVFERPSELIVTALLLGCAETLGATPQSTEIELDDAWRAATDAAFAGLYAGVCERAVLGGYHPANLTILRLALEPDLRLESVMHTWGFPEILGRAVDNEAFRRFPHAPYPATPSLKRGLSRFFTWLDERAVCFVESPSLVDAVLAAAGPSAAALASADDTDTIRLYESGQIDVIVMGASLAHCVDLTDTSCVLTFGEHGNELTLYNALAYLDCFANERPLRMHQMLVKTSYAVYTADMCGLAVRMDQEMRQAFKDRRGKQIRHIVANFTAQWRFVRPDPFLMQVLNQSDQLKASMNPNLRP